MTYLDLSTSSDVNHSWEATPLSVEATPLPGNVNATTASSGDDLVVWKADNKTRNAVIGSIMVLVNALTLVTVVKTRSLRAHTKLLVGSLTCTDLLMGLITLLPRLLHDSLHYRSDQPMCVVRFFLVLTSVYGSCLSITAITGDRCMALTLPIVYRTSVTVCKALIVVAMVWALSLLLTAASLARGFQSGTSCELILVVDTGGMLLMGYVLSACVLLITAMYAYIGHTLWRRRTRVHALQMNTHTHTSTAAAVFFSSSPPSTSSAAAPPQLQQQRQQTQLQPQQQRSERENSGGGASNAGGLSTQTFSMKQERRTTVTAIVLAVCFLLGYLPLALYLLWVVHSGTDRLQEAHTQRLLIIIVCPLGNCILDPLVYFWRLQNWRQCSAGIFGRCRSFVVNRRGRGGGVTDSSAEGVVVVTQVTQRTAA